MRKLLKAVLVLLVMLLPVAFLVGAADDPDCGDVYNHMIMFEGPYQGMVFHNDAEQNEDLYTNVLVHENYTTHYYDEMGYSSDHKKFIFWDWHVPCDPEH